MHLKQQLHITQKIILPLDKNTDFINWQQFPHWIVSIELSCESIVGANQFS